MFHWSELPLLINPASCPPSPQVSSWPPLMPSLEFAKRLLEMLRPPPDDPELLPEPLPDDPEPLPDDPEPLPDDPEPLPDDPAPLPEHPELLPDDPEPLPEPVKLSSSHYPRSCRALSVRS